MAERNFGLDTAQSASNAIAGGVSAPIDLIAALLTKLGLPGMEKPIGGSVWMANQGLTRDVPQGTAQVLGETIGNVLPIGVAAKSKELAQVLSRLGANAEIPRSAGFAAKQRGALDLQKLRFDPKEGIGSVPFNADIDYFGFTKNMPSSEFSRLALPTELSEKNIKWIMQQLEQGAGLGNPFFNVKWQPDAQTFQIVGHEGRHRMEAIRRLFGGDPEVPVHIFPTGGMRAKHITEQMRSAPLLKELAR